MGRTPLNGPQVIEAAAELADAEGLDAVTLTRVAEILGVRQPALYRHVRHFDDLIRSLGLRGRELLADRLRQSAVGVSGDEAVFAVARAWRVLQKEHPGLYAATDRYPCAGDDELEAAVENIVTIIAQALGSYDLTEVDKMHAARSLRSAFHGFAHLESGDGHPHPHDPDDTFDHLVELLIAGIKSMQTVPVVAR
jgi:AcrR family transcriptional regulator